MLKIPNEPLPDVPPEGVVLAGGSEGGGVPYIKGTASSARGDGTSAGKTAARPREGSQGVAQAEPESAPEPAPEAAPEPPAAKPPAERKNLFLSDFFN
jgi:penicillin-binding protein 1B